MALTLNTPGVYVEEVNLLPPSVAQVATAIPAFIGYTEKAENPDGSSLKLKPTRITSLLDYETLFGRADNEENIIVSVVGNTIKSTLEPADRSPFLMYYSVQMYFANGGGPCYIVSVDQQYGTDPAVIPLKAGLDALEKEDEPTLILFPDITALPPTDAYPLYNNALAQCNKLQDRFTIIDTIMANPKNPINSEIDADFQALRQTISDNADKKYGAAYYPYLKSILDYQYLDGDVSVSIASSTNYDAQATTISNGPVSNCRTALTTYRTDLTTLQSLITTDTNPDAKAIELIPEIRSKILQIAGTSNTLISSLTDMVNIGRTLVANGDPMELNTSNLLQATNALDAWITQKPETFNLDLSTCLDDLNLASDEVTVSAVITDVMASFTSTDIIAGITAMQQGPLGEIFVMIAALTPFSAATTNTNLEALRTSNNVLYNRIKASISQIPLLIPPSSSIAGVYAYTDSTSGVWKAPANVSLNYVVGPNYVLSNDQQGGMNIDEDGGKSINAIRAFTGKGTLVWGARTLAGASNEWKYVSVRRFYNMVEESVKKATGSFVFQANDANTWVQVRAMIENFLILQWKAGALAGSKPEQAFYVKIGLGATMTADDVLNGRMIVEIGMAVVRPAEFIVLRFSHMMQQA